MSEQNAWRILDLDNTEGILCCSSGWRAYWCSWTLLCKINTVIASDNAHDRVTYKWGDRDAYFEHVVIMTTHVFLISTETGRNCEKSALQFRCWLQKKDPFLAPSKLGKWRNQLLASDHHRTKESIPGVATTILKISVFAKVFFLCHRKEVERQWSLRTFQSFMKSSKN